MNTETILAMVVVILGWFVAYHFEKQRDRFNKRRELRVQFLIAAYRNLESASNRQMCAATATSLERAIADIQLFGSTTQVRLAHEASDYFAKTGSVSLDHLLQDLRQDLRQELNLETLSSNVRPLRIELPK